MKTPPERGADPPSRAPAPYAPASGATGRSDGQTLGELLRELRTGHGFSTRRLAARAAVSRSTIQRLEHGTLRPRPSTLALIASALDPDRRAEIRARLVAAAGDDLAPHNEAWSWYQAHRLQAGLEAGDVPMALAWERRLRLFTAGEAMWHLAMQLGDMAGAVIDEPGPRFDDLMRLDSALRDEAGRLHKEAGGTFGGAARPLRRWRGDPADVSPFPPSLADLSAVWRWLWAWQCREGRLRPRSAWERAVAQTGARERQAVRDAPERPPARHRTATEGRQPR